MPKENTHLFFANNVLASIDQNEIKRIIQRNFSSYQLGSVLIDSFFYSTKNKSHAVSDYLHGWDGNSTNETIFALLDHAKTQQSEKELAFVFGFISHCVLDMAFHPVIIYLVGNADSSNREKAQMADYRHRCWETILDKELRHSFWVENLRLAPEIDQLYFFDYLEEKFCMPAKQLKQISRNFLLVAGWVRGKSFYYLARFLNWLGMIKKESLGVFYYHVPIEPMSIPDKIIYRDIISGEEKITSIKQLLFEAQGLLLPRLKAAFDYYKNKINRQRAQFFIPGESLETGLVGYAMKDIRYTYDK